MPLAGSRPLPHLTHTNTLDACALRARVATARPSPRRRIAPWRKGDGATRWVHSMHALGTVLEGVDHATLYCSLGAAMRRTPPQRANQTVRGCGEEITGSSGRCGARRRDAAAMSGCSCAQHPTTTLPRRSKRRVQRAAAESAATSSRRPRRLRSSTSAAPSTRRSRWACRTARAWRPARRPARRRLRAEGAEGLAQKASGRSGPA